MLPSPHQPHQQGVAPEPRVLGVRLASEASTDQWDENRRKAPKVSRACDFCKQKRVRCSGTVPCHTCQHRRIECTWNATHNRGRPATPATSSDIPATHQSTYDVYGLHSHPATVPRATQQVISQFGEGHNRSGHASTRESPDLETAEVDGQYHDRTSALTFIRRAWHRLSSSEGGDPVQRILGDAPYAQKITAEGDRPFRDDEAVTAAVPSAAVAHELISFYLDTCAVTYRFLHGPTVYLWLEGLLGVPIADIPRHAPQGSRAAIVYTIFAISAYRKEQIRSSTQATLPESRESDLYFQTAELLASQETGRVSLQSVQARLLQVLYLLQTQRVTQAWYTFGALLQMTSALGLHRRETRRRGAYGDKSSPDYITSECRKRTFWAAYTMDTYLCVVLGRPKHFHDEDIDQTLPESVIDEEITSEGPKSNASENDSLIDGLVHHSRLAQLLGAATRDVYSVKKISRQARMAAVDVLRRQLRQWKDRLPPHLGTVRPSSLIPSLMRQSVALKLAYAHANMHIFRPLLLENVNYLSGNVTSGVQECLEAARIAMETINGMANNGSLFYSLWWINYVVFCAVSVVYIADIQASKDNSNNLVAGSSREDLMELAERCQQHLSDSNTSSRRYAVVLDELLREAKRTRHRGLQRAPNSIEQRECPDAMRGHDKPEGSRATGGELDSQQVHQAQANSLDFDSPLDKDYNFLDEWSISDWLELDSSVWDPQIF
ncbi:hypothetical protein NU195Hw_g5725t1 [Hortaea werneckii]